MIGNLPNTINSEGSASTTLPDVYLGSLSDTLPLSDLLDTVNLTVEKGTIPVLFTTGVPSKGSQSVARRYLWKLGAGEFNPIGGENIESKLELIEETFLSVKNLEAVLTSENAQEIALGVIADDFISYMNNNGTYALTNVDKTYIVTFTTNDIDYAYIFQGTLGNYGVGNLQFVEDDFIFIYQSTNAGETKLDKSSTPSSVYGTDVSGGQTMIPLTNFGTVKGTGTTNRISKFTASGTIGDSQIFDNGTNVGVGAESTSARLEVRAQGAISTDIVFRVRNSTDTTNLFQITGVGNVFLANNNFIGFRNAANNGDVPVIQFTNTNQLNLGTNSSSLPSAIGLWTNSTERIRVLNNGNVNIGSFTNIESALLVLNSTSKGFLPPRMTTVERNAIISPVAGLIVYNTTDNKHYGFNGTTWNAFY